MQVRSYEAMRDGDASAFCPAGRCSGLFHLGELFLSLCLQNGRRMRFLIPITALFLICASCARQDRHADYVLEWKGDGLKVTLKVNTPLDTVRFTYASDNGGQKDQMSWFQDFAVDRGSVSIDSASRTLTIVPPEEPSGVLLRSALYASGRLWFAGRMPDGRFPAGYRRGHALFADREHFCRSGGR